MSKLSPSLILAAIGALFAMPSSADAASSIAILPFNYSRRVRSNVTIVQRGSDGSTWVLTTRDKISVEFETHAFTNKFITSLVKERKFEVVERRRLDKLLAEQKLSKAGLVDPARAIQMGRLLGADYFVMAEISVFNVEASYKFFRPLGRYKRVGRINLIVDMRVVDTKTGKIVLAEKGSIIKDISTAATLMRPSPTLVAPSTVDAIQRELCEQLTRKIVAGLYPLKVIKFTRGIAYLNRGSKAGMRVGAQYSVFSQGEALIDEDTGLNLGAEETQIAVIRVDETRPRFSKARLTQWTCATHDIPRGSICRPFTGVVRAPPLPPPPPRDTSPPVLTILSPASGLLTREARVTVLLRIEEEKLDKVLVAGRKAFPRGDGSYACNLLIGEGENLIRCEAWDRAGNCGRAQVTVTRDTTPPLARILSPVPDSLVAGSPVTVIAEVLGANRVKICGARARPTGPNQFSLAVKARGGVNEVWVEAWDRAGNYARSSSRFRLDDKGPTVRVISPPRGSLVNVRRVRFIVECLDADLASIFINGKKARSLAYKRPGKRHRGRAVPAPRGRYAVSLRAGGPRTSVEIKAIDRAGNLTRTTSFFLVDTQAPRLRIRSPRTGSMVSSRKVEVLLTSPDKDIVRVLVNGVAAAPVGAGRYCANIKARDGSNAVMALAYDRAGNCGSARGSFIYDAAPPSIRILSPHDGTLLRAPACKVVLWSPDDDIDRILVNGVMAVASGGGRYTATITAEPGTNSIMALAYDRAGQTGVARVRVSLDASPPRLRFLAPKRGATLNSNPINVWVHSPDSDIASLRINGVAATPRGKGRWAAQITGREGTNDIRVEAVDRAGNIGRLAMRFNFDSTPPDLTAKATVIVRGRVDDLQSRVTVNGKPVVLKADGSYAVEVDLGKDRKVVIVATDSFGNARRIVKRY